MVKLTEEQRSLVSDKINAITAEHFRAMKRLRKDFEAERSRLERMLRADFVPQIITAEESR